MRRMVVAPACPKCSEALQAQSTRHGIVWVCPTCGGCAANLAVIRKLAPAQFVTYLWLAALEAGTRSALQCPSCQQPLLDFGADVELSPACRVCRRCFLLWFDHDAFAVVATAAPAIGTRRDLPAMAPGAAPHVRRARTRVVR